MNGMTPMWILFARHGQSTANLLQVIANRHSDHPLTDLGRSQAQELAVVVTPYAVRRIVTSPIRRAMETAEIVGGVLGLPVEGSDALREFDCGVFEGRADPTAWAAHAAVQREWFELGRPDARIEGGESLTDLRARFRPFVAAVADDVIGQGAGATLVISHGGLLQCLLPEILDGIDPPTARGHGMSNTAIVVAKVDPSGRLTASGWPA